MFSFMWWSDRECLPSRGRSRAHILERFLALYRRPLSPVERDRLPIPLPQRQGQRSIRLGKLPPLRQHWPLRYPLNCHYRRPTPLPPPLLIPDPLLTLLVPSSPVGAQEEFVVARQVFVFVVSVWIVSRYNRQTEPTEVRSTLPAHHLVAPVDLLKTKIILNYNNNLFIVRNNKIGKLLNAWMDRMDVWMKICLDGFSDWWTPWTDGWLNGWIFRKTGVWMDECLDGWIFG